MPENSQQGPSFPQATLDLPVAQRIAKAVEHYGEAEVVARSISLMDGRYEGEEFLLYVGGEHAQGILNGAPVLYWPELWGLRALQHVWSDTAISPVLESLKNPAWRVREMGCRVIASRGLPAADELLALTADGTPRVRAAAARALGAVGNPDDLEGLRAFTKDPVLEVRRSAQQGIDALRSRFPSTR
ncbi:HEAT repeat domain-containing protein [Leucobacter sp. G161]|uniref:HEAT repeat domain-containing protein n=1 Tax=Leucobacter sp. G161 TaxID=663704 RepID=UPI001F22AD40|nr:HEAT repeat domain-containing protein [Leucobacter sp. G161]